MKIGLYSAVYSGEVKDRSIDYIAVDGGLKHLIDQNIQPKKAIGDFDSLASKELLKGLDVEILPCIKDVTDTHAALDYVIEEGYDGIDLYGVTGKRIDHFFAVMCLLIQHPDINITIYDKHNKIQLLNKGTHEIDHSYKYFSFFALEDVEISISGAHYNLDHYLLKKEDPLCVSNQTDDQAVVTLSSSVIFIQSND